MENQEKAPSVSSLFCIASKLEDVDVVVNRIAGILNLLTDVLGDEVKFSPYNQYYIDVIYACRDYAQSSHTEMLAIKKKLYAIYFANKKQEKAS